MIIRKCEQQKVIANCNSPAKNASIAGVTLSLWIYGVTSPERGGGGRNIRYGIPGSFYWAVWFFSERRCG